MAVAYWPASALSCPSCHDSKVSVGLVLTCAAR